jgi:protein TonB
VRIYTLALSVVAHLLVLAGIVVVPLVATDVLPEPHRTVQYIHVIAPPVMPPPVRPHESQPAEPLSPATTPFEEPRGIEPEPAPLPSDSYAVPPSIVEGTWIQGVGAADDVAPPPEPRERAPIRVGGSITRPERVHDVPPLYPAVARQARIEGTVILEALIDVDGAVRKVRVLRSVPLLDTAAIDAVRQWRFTPTRLNGDPVPVVMTVTVTFKLQ